MKEVLVGLISLTVLLSCSNDKNSGKKSIAKKEYKSKWEEVMASLKDTATSKLLDIDPAHFDTTGISGSPVQVLSVDTSEEKDAFGIHEYNVITFTFKNITTKTIEGVKMRWYCEDAFGEPVLLSTMYPLSFLIGEGQSDDHVLSGKNGILTWKGSFSKMRVIKAWPYQVAFADKTIWNITK